MTVTLFTTIFLACNLPFFLNNVLFFATLLTAPENYPEPYFTSTFMDNYSWMLSKVHFTVFNATVNPILYYTRFKKFRMWMTKAGFKNTGNDSETSIRQTQTRNFTVRLGDIQNEQT